MANKITTKESLKAELLRMRRLAKKGYTNTRREAQAVWTGYDQACFDLQQRFQLINIKP